MDSDITVETLPLLGICNLCLNEGAVKSMLTTYNHNGIEESYDKMLHRCFSIAISTLELGDMKRLICEPCVNKLRDCLEFREQVETSLKTLETSLSVQKDDSLKSEITAAQYFNDIHFDGIDVDHNDDGDDDDDDTVLKDIKIKMETEKEESIVNFRTKKTRRINLSSSKKRVIKLPMKKHCDTSETDTMITLGLFPFKVFQNKTFACSICPLKSTELDDIKTHVAKHNKKNIHYAFQKMIMSKSQRFYKTTTKLRCKICTTDICNYEELKQHIENCTRLKHRKFKWNGLPFKLEKDQLDCPICKKTFLNFVTLNTHMNLHYPNHICENCGKAFASTARLRGHIRTHETGEFPCRYCDAVFDRVTKRENHVSKEHKAGVRYACRKCNITLSSFYAKQKHLAEVHNEELKRYKCKVCPQSYITPGHLSSHVRRDHLNERNHKCDKCDQAFYTKNALKMHMVKHDGERIHSCPVCQKSYQRKKTLREHMRIHDNDKRFVCPVCGRAFTQKCTLKGHLKVHDRKLDLEDTVVHSI